MGVQEVGEITLIITWVIAAWFDWLAGILCQAHDEGGQLDRPLEVGMWPAWTGEL